jgi:hypothetical protein
VEIELPREKSEKNLLTPNPKSVLCFLTLSSAALLKNSREEGEISSAFLTDTSINKKSMKIRKNKKKSYFTESLLKNHK